jgi:hypothetical protein
VGQVIVGDVVETAHFIAAGKQRKQKDWVSISPLRAHSEEYNFFSVASTS